MDPDILVAGLLLLFAACIGLWAIWCIGTA